MVKYEDFKLRVSDLVKKHYENLGRVVDVSIMKVRKTNGVELDGLVISRRDGFSNISPTIYLNGYYRDFLDGKSLVYVLDEIIKVNDENQISSFDVGTFIDFEKAKKQIKCRIINTELLKSLFEFNVHEVAIPVVSWSIAGFFKERLKHVGWKMPHLMIIGEAGSGKSSATLILRVWQKPHA